MHSTLSLLALGLATTAVAQTPGSIVEKGETLVSAMMVRILVTTCSTPPSSPHSTTDVPRQ